MFNLNKANEVKQKLEYIFHLMKMNMEIEIIKQDENEYSIFIEEDFELTDSVFTKYHLIKWYTTYFGDWFEPPEEHDEEIGDFHTLNKVVAKIAEIKADECEAEYDREKLIKEEVRDY